MLLLVFAFIVVPIVELYVIIQVGEAIGVLPTIALLIADAVLGAVLLRMQGRAAWRRFTAALAEGRVPHREVLDGALVIFGGALLLTPGFVTDIFGLLFLLPPTRTAIRNGIVLIFSRRAARGAAIFWTFRGPGGSGGGGGPRRPPEPPPWPPASGNGGAHPSYDFEGTGHEIPDYPPELP